MAASCLTSDWEAKAFRRSRAFVPSIRITVTSMIVGSGFATFAITEIANFCTTDSPFEPATLANNTNQLFVFTFSIKSISRPCELSRHQDARQEYAAAT